MKVKKKAHITSRPTELKERRILPAVLLFFLAPLFGEYLLGILSLSEIYYVLFLSPMYGGGAILIREVTRRAGQGTVMLLILGIAYGLIEEGIVDQMLFNPNYLAGQEWNSYISFLGMDGRLTIYVLAMHAVWSTCIPILLIEALFPERKLKPWLSKKGLGFVAALFIIGSAYLCYETKMEKHFFASVPQLLGTTLTVIILVIVSFKCKYHTSVSLETPAPKPWFIGGVSFITSSLFMLADSSYGWVSFGACVILATGFFLMVYHWSGRNDWGDNHRIALIGGGILTYVWLGMFSGSIIFGFGAIVLLILANRRLKKTLSY
ncbi:hypothetical protein Q7A53_08405 [Halobacillus rhizosphaerae]|uniref:hypothetical protein n=1 Tax=Halobacillus rhizosphaerae TaxID=3064889 RepID=UPI00398AD376